MLLPYYDISDAKEEMDSVEKRETRTVFGMLYESRRWNRHPDRECSVTPGL